MPHKLTFVPLSLIRLTGLVLVLSIVAGDQPSLATVLAMTLAVLLVALVASGYTSAPTALAYAETLRQRSRRIAFLPQCDPDAPGRPRPRAPSPA